MMSSFRVVYFLNKIPAALVLGAIKIKFLLNSLMHNCKHRAMQVLAPCSTKPNLLLSPQYQLPQPPPSTQNEDEILTLVRHFVRECLDELICKLWIQEISVVKQC